MIYLIRHFMPCGCANSMFWIHQNEDDAKRQLEEFEANPIDGTYDMVYVSRDEMDAYQTDENGMAMDIVVCIKHAHERLPTQYHR